MNNSFISNSSLFDKNSLENQVLSNLKSRISSSQSYSKEEIIEISTLSKTLFKGMQINKETTKRFRTLCTLSQNTLKPPRNITSHRKYIGPFIVAFKKAFWPIINIYLKDTFRAVAEFQAQSVEIAADQQKKIENIKKN